MQDAISSEKKPGRSLSQWVTIGVVALLAGLILVGIINDATGEQAVFGPQQPFLILAILAFSGGVLSFLSPCTLPILPAYFAFATSSGRKSIATNTVMFVLGLATVFSLLGASASALGSLLRDFQDFILIFGGALVLVFGVMSLMGKGFTGMTQEEETVQASGLGGSFIFGMTFAAGWSSCIGPILGIMLTMAATTASVMRGAILLFIFAVGLGLPLIVVSTFIGRTSRQSVIWRILRGKGWFINVPKLAVGAIWAVTAWWVIQALLTYSFANFATFGGRELATFQSIGILAIALLAAVLWSVTLSGEGSKTELHLHSTSLVSGVLFVALGYFMLSGRMTAITARLTEITAQMDWYNQLLDMEDWLYGIFS
ncbi:MAG: cytochrome c biogenesis protein CcdA [Ardenticatenaceae bacterium]|nr:cytochrome c biogenesis protein CcdA [Ardenticatenaceae bacterium]